MTREVVRLRELWDAWVACRRRKRGTRDCLRYGGRLLDRLAETRMALDAGTWRPSRARVFVTTRPKAREIHAPLFSDRVVHHWLVPQLERYFEPVFIHDSYANRVGKGTHAAVDRLQTFMRKATANGERRAWALQLDVSNCFNSIDRRRLYGMLRQRIEARSAALRVDPARQKLLLGVARALLTGNPGVNAHRLGHPSRFDRVPPHKRLANAEPECGLAIGNLSSQFFANVYLNDLDQFVKHSLRCGWYLRYVDDFVLLSTCPAELRQWRERIREHLAQRLGMALRDPAVEPVPVSTGVDFLGYIVRPGYRLARRRVVVAARCALRKWQDRVVSQTGISLDAPARRGLRATLGSYLGHFRHAAGTGNAQALWDEFPWLGRLASLRGGRAEFTFQPPLSTSYAGQYSWFKACYATSIVWMHNGGDIECFLDDAEALAQRYGLATRPANQQELGRRIVIPKNSWLRVRERLIADRVPAVLVEQDGYVRSHRRGLRGRALAWVSPTALAGHPVQQHTLPCPGM